MPSSAAARMGLRAARTGLWVGHTELVPAEGGRRGGAEPGEREEVSGVSRPWIPWRRRGRAQGAGGRARGACRGSHPGFTLRFCGPGAAPEL